MKFNKQEIAELISNINKLRMLSGENVDKEAFSLSQKFEKVFDIKKGNLDPKDFLEIGGAVATEYYRLGQWEIASKMFRKICDMGEKYDPYTSETAGDYYKLSICLENENRIEEALEAAEKSLEHLKPTPVFSKYKEAHIKRKIYLSSLAKSISYSSSTTKNIEESPFDLSEINQEIPSLPNEKRLNQDFELSNISYDQISKLATRFKTGNKKIDKLFEMNQPFSFLIGAGCSVDAPSCLPSGQQMMRTIIKYTCHESEQEKINKLKELRFEELIQILQENIDFNLKTIEYFDQCDKPNINHYFVAEMIKKGHFVITTNFDHLIEYALLNSHEPKENIIPIITRKDFDVYYNPYELFKNGKKILCKIHGSCMNAITKANTKDSLIVTIKSFNIDKRGFTVFQLEPFKRSLVHNMLDNRNLVIMGYSGSDDFDILPTLKCLNKIKSIIWINHCDLSVNNAKISEIQTINSKMEDNNNKVNQILSDIKSINLNAKVYRIDINTAKLTSELINAKPRIYQHGCSLNLMNWLENNITKPDEIAKLIIPIEIYLAHNRDDDVLRCCHKLLPKIQAEKRLINKGNVLNTIGMIHFRQQKYNEAIEYYKEALSICKKLKNLKFQMSILVNLGAVYEKFGDYSIAIEQYNNALNICEEIGEIENKSVCLNNLGEIYRQQGHYDKALKYYNEALGLDDYFGNLTFKAIRFNNIGLIHKEKGNFETAKKMYREALQINEQLGDVRAKAHRLVNLAEIDYLEGFYKEALRKYNEALNIYKIFNDISRKSICLNHMGGIYQKLGDSDKALKMHEQAMQNASELNELSTVATSLGYIGRIYSHNKEYKKALDYYKKSLQIVEQLNELNKKASLLEDIGIVNMRNGDYEKAFPFFNDALNINLRLKDKIGITWSYNNLGMLHMEQCKYQEALHYFKNAIENSIKVEALKNDITLHSNLGICYRFLKNYILALETLFRALAFADQKNDMVSKSMILYNIGELYLAQNRYSEAIKIFDERIKICNKINDFNSKANSLSYIGLIQFTQMKYEESLKKYLDAMEIHQKLKNQIELARCQYMLGAINFNIGELHKALEWFEKSYSIYLLLNQAGSDIALNLKMNIEDLRNRLGITMH